jgi:hypothetical protein
MRTFAAAALAALVVSCTPPAAEQDVRALAEGETRLDGVVILVEDGGYPQFTVTVRPDNGGEDMTLYLNAESGADLGGQEPSSFADQNVIAYYTTVDNPLLQDMQRPEGQSILPAGGMPAAADSEYVTGTLSGAEAATAGDLPDVVTIADAQGVAHRFELYITESVVAANGQQVRVQYLPAVRHEITLLHSLLPDH